MLQEISRCRECGCICPDCSDVCDCCNYIENIVFEELMEGLMDEETDYS
jgi:hypothetical protein